MTDTKRSMQCGHCGKPVTFTVRADWKKDEAPIIDSPYNEGQEIITWRIFECAGCKNPTLTETRELYEFVDHEIYAGVELVSSETLIHFPEDKAAQLPLTNLPKTIEKEYQDTLKVREISIIACAVLARRILEAILAHEKAEGKTLMEQINHLMKSERIPPLLADMAHLGRKIGNLAAHFAKEQVTEDDVTAMLDFVEGILEYLYVAPAKIAVVQERLRKTP